MFLRVPKNSITNVGEPEIVRPHILGVPILVKCTFCGYPLYSDIY